MRFLMMANNPAILIKNFFSNLYYVFNAGLESRF